jgi:protein involved in polysaccharide export with SLBB domain
MSKILIFLFSASVLAQIPTEKAIMEEANRRNINSIEEALAELNKNGISETQARTLALQQGISFDAFLNNNFTAKSSQQNATIPDPDTAVLLSPEPTTPVVVKLAENTPKDLPKQDPFYFGYSIFNKNPFLEKEYLLGNIDEGYLVAPGDVLRVIVFGNNSLELEATVDRNGNINIPSYGVFFAAGNNFKTLRKRLRIYLGKFFSGLLTTPQNTFLDVSLTQLKPTKVVVVGQVNAPGPHILTTQANPLAALYSAGGVKTTGSLREIRIYRNNKLFETVDLYDYIVSGTLNKNITLTNNDVVFVPPRISTVLLKGEVKKKGYYELKPDEVLTHLIAFSGGLPTSAARDRVNVLRIDPSNDASDNTDKSLITTNLKALAASNSDFELFDGDEVSILPLLDRVSNRVSIQGNVYSPGEYSLTKYNDLKALIINAARGVKEDTFFDKIDVKGIVLPTGEETFATYNLADVLSGAVQVPLSDRDNVTVYSSAKVQGDLYVSISGYGVENSSPTVWRENLSLYDLIFENTAFQSVNFRKNLFDVRLDIKSYDVDSRRYITVPFDFRDESALKSVYLKPFDRVILYNKNVTELDNDFVKVTGFVNNPGSFKLEQNMYVEDAILLAGGFSDLADQTVVYVNKQELDPETEITSLRYDITIDLDYINGLKAVPSNGFVLGFNDIISVRKDLAYENQQSIAVSGEVNYPRTVVASTKQVSLRYLLDEVGGLTDYALLNSSYAIRDGKVLVLDLATINKNKPVFQNGDQLIISKNFGSVNTQGAVENPSIFDWKKGKRAKYYISNSGGKLPKIGGKRYVVFNNGKTTKIGFFKNPRVFPDSKIVVNYKSEKEKVDSDKFLNNTTNILGTLTGALTTILLLERL